MPDKKCLDQNFYGNYENFRSKLDYNYHSHYSKERQLLQDKLITEYLAKYFARNLADLREHPSFQGAGSPDSQSISASDSPSQLIYTAGPMGAGKTYSLKFLAPNLGINLSDFVIIDPDGFKDLIPEYQALKKTEPCIAASTYHAESAFLAELALEIALSRGLNIVSDGSLLDWKWYSEEIARIRGTYPNYQTISIIYVEAHWERIKERVEQRCQMTGRCVNLTKLQKTYEKVSQSVEKLKPLMDCVYYVKNDAIPRVEKVYLKERR